MASPFQQQALRRKLIYIGIIIALFSVSVLVRLHLVQPRAQALALRDQDAGNAELAGSAVRLSLTGLRGVVVCALWNNAIDKQKKNQWDEFEILARSITKLQPHFITPWLWQSWNVSYNIAVKCDLPRDKYFYIARGIELLAEGERQNRYQPDLRFSMGTYYQQKIPMHDHRIPLQALLEMSAIDPLHRQSQWFWAMEKDAAGNFQFLRDKYGHRQDLDPDGRIIPRDREGRPVDASGRPVQLDNEHRPRFEQFCLEHPRLLRRLRQQLGFNTPEKVGKWLDENLKIPSLFGDVVDGEGRNAKTRPRLNREDPFPLVPQGDSYNPGRPPDDEALAKLGQEADGFALAREWYAYAQLPVPDPDPEMPGTSQPVTDPIRQRPPGHMTTILFRNFPPRAQSYVGERLEEDGWFDASGWKVTGLFRGDRFSTGEPAVIGIDRKWAQDAFEYAHQMWTKHGLANHLLFSADDEEAARKEADLERQAQRYRKAHNLARSSPDPRLRPEEENDPEMAASKHAHDLLRAYDHYRVMTNFEHFYFGSRAEAEPDTVAARKGLYDAEQLRLEARAQALPAYEDALKRWAKALADHPRFRSNDIVQEDSFEAQWNYTQLFHDSPAGRVLKQQLFAQALLGESLLPAPSTAWLAAAQLARPQGVAAPVLNGPLDGVDSKGHELLDSMNVEAVLRRKNLIHTPLMPKPGTKISPEMLRMMGQMPGVSPGGRMPGMPGGAPPAPPK
jgi:hypothetical protein